MASQCLFYPLKLRNTTSPSSFPKTNLQYNIYSSTLARKGPIWLNCFLREHESRVGRQNEVYAKVRGCGAQVSCFCPCKHKPRGGRNKIFRHHATSFHVYQNLRHPPPHPLKYYVRVIRLAVSGWYVHYFSVHVQNFQIADPGLTTHPCP